MNAQPSFDPPESPQRRQSTRRRSRTATTQTTPVSARQPKRKSTPDYAHRRQGVVVSLKIVTYSALSVFGLLTLVNLLSYNWSQQTKLQHLETELKDAHARTQKVNASFNRSFDLHSQQSVMEENTYKISNDRLPIVLIPTTPATPAVKK